MTRPYDTIRPVRWAGDALELIDQRLLPHEEKTLRFDSVEEVAVALSDMVVRGAPAIGCTAAFGMVLAARGFTGEADRDKALLAESKRRLADTRPTAVNLFWALDRMEKRLKAFLGRSSREVEERALEAAQTILKEDLGFCYSIGDHGADLIAEGATVLTHCNAGALATAGYGTALGVIRSAYAQGKVQRVIACETRPRQQGARLTAWELHKESIPVTLISDTAAGHMLSSGEVSCVCVGADRVATNGDVANKIGTYSLAVVAKENRVPFYVAAPTSTLDADCETGDSIVIEHRQSDEVTHCQGSRVAPRGVQAVNPAFDVTPSRYVQAIVTQKGVAVAPFTDSLTRFLKD